MKIIAAAAIAVFVSTSAFAQMPNRITTCGTATPPAGNSNSYMDQTGNGCVTSKQQPNTIVPLDVKTVTTGGTAVTALNSGHRTAGGYLITSNAAGICISENGTAGTATGYVGSTLTTCVSPNQTYGLTANAGAVSVNSTASGVALSGYGLQ